MTEQSEWIGRRNFDLNSDVILRDAYRLLTTVLADRAIAEEAIDEDDPLAHLREQFVQDELIHTLISLSVVNRLHDEHMRGPRGDQNELSFPPLQHICGRLRPDMGSQIEQPLQFRDACNKIIHALHIDAQTVSSKNCAFSVLPRFLKLYGERTGADWEATLDVVEFIKATVRNFRG
jgi:hypothetical protein